MKKAPKGAFFVNHKNILHNAYIFLMEKCETI